MSSKLLQFNKPISVDSNRIKFHIHYWLIRLPSAALTIPSAYGVGAFASEKLPLLMAIFAGIAYEAAFIGAIAIADNQYTLKRKDKQAKWYQQINSSAILWWLLMLVAVLSSVLSNLLFFAGGSYASITPEIITHAVPLPVVNFMYNLVLHNAVTQKQNTAVCIKCGKVFEGVNCIDQLNGHKGQCKA